MTKRKSSDIWPAYVKYRIGRGSYGFAVQLPADNPWGFSLHTSDQEFPGGVGLASKWKAVPRYDVPARVREELDWILEDYYEQLYARKYE